MANVEAQAHPRPPSAKVIAFAVSVVRSKPPELSVGEYIRLLGLHIAKGSRAGAVSSTYQHLDRSAYWRSESERVQGVLKITQDVVVDLQREVTVLKARLDVAKLAIPSKKRKKNDGDTIPYPRSPKRSKPDALSVRSGVLGTFDSSIEAEFRQAGEIGNALLRSLFPMHAFLKCHSKLDATELAYHIVRASSSMSQLVLDELKAFLKSNSHDGNGLERVLLLARRAVYSIIGGFSRLSHLACASGSESRAVYAIVKMFKALLAGVAQLSEAEVNKLLITNAAATKLAAEKPKGKGKTPRVLNIKENATLSKYTAFLKSIMDQLDAKNEGHLALFEGFACCVLETAGNRMYHSVFGHARGRTLEAEILQSNVTDDAEDSELKQVRLEAPYLVALMDRVMAAAPSFLGAATSAKTGKPKQAHNRASMKGALAVEAKDRLQRTLITCMFGGTEGMSGDMFAECLKMPANMGTIPMPKVKEPEVQDWFKEEMWRLLGWEILSKEGDW